MKREGLRILGAFLVLVGLLGFYSWKTKKAGEKGEREEKEKKLVEVNFKDIGRIEVTTESGKIAFERRPTNEKGEYTDSWAELSQEFDSISEWAIVEPFKYLPEYYSMKTLLSNIEDLQFTKIIDEKGTNPGAYGLASPLMKIDLFRKDKAPGISIHVGEENSAGTDLYVQTSQNPRIVLAGKVLAYIKVRTLTDWRRKEVFGIRDLKKATRLEVAYIDPKLPSRLVLAQESGQWNLVEPLKLPADEKEVEDFLSSLKALRANSFSSDNADNDAKSYGLDRPYAKITVTTKDGEKEVTRTILVGNKFEKEKDIFVRRAEFPQVFAVRHGVKETLSKKAADFVEKRPMRLSIGMVTGYTVTKDGTTTELEKKGEKWQLLRPVQDRVNNEKAGSVLSSLSDLRAEEYLGTGAKLPSHTPEALFRVKMGEKTKELALYRKGAEFIAERKDPQMYYRFKAASFDGIFDSLGKVRERRFVAMDPQELAAVSVAKGELKVRYKQAKEGQWVADDIQGAPGALSGKLRDPKTAESLIKVLKDLELESFSDVGADAGKEEIRVELMPKEGDTTVWSIGRKEDTARWVRSEKRSVVGKVPGNKVDELEKLLTAETAKKG